jgi:hypothetical protein
MPEKTRQTFECLSRGPAVGSIRDERRGRRLLAMPNCLNRDVRSFDSTQLRGPASLKKTTALLIQTNSNRHSARDLNAAKCRHRRATKTEIE